DTDQQSPRDFVEVAETAPDEDLTVWQRLQNIDGCRIRRPRNVDRSEVYGSGDKFRAVSNINRGFRAPSRRQPPYREMKPIRSVGVKHLSVRLDGNEPYRDIKKGTRKGCIQRAVLAKQRVVGGSAERQDKTPRRLKASEQQISIRHDSLLVVARIE